MSQSDIGSFRKIEKVSIVVLAYNHYSSLADCFGSIEKQNYEQIEIILADDGSKGIVKEEIASTVDSIIHDKYETVFCFNEKNVGTVKNFNNAILQSTGDLIIPLSMDDRFTDECVVSKIVEFFNSKKVLLATSYSCFVKGNSIQIKPTKNELKLLDNVDRTNRRQLTFGLFRGANLYYHRDIFNKMGLFDENYTLYEDVPFLFKYFDKGNVISVLPYVTIYYSKGGMSSNYKKAPKALVDDRIRLYEGVLANKKYKRIHRWMKCKIFEHKFPDSKLKRIILFPDVMLEKEWHKFVCCRDKSIRMDGTQQMEEYVKKVNSTLSQNSR